MNKAQKEVQQAQLSDEQKTIKQLQRIYDQARRDCEQKIRELSSRPDLENLQSIIYQKQYQEALKKQLDSIIDNLQSEEFLSVADYLQKSYENGYVGVMYDLHRQGIPVIMPINQEQVVKALQTDSKLSENLYQRLGEDTEYLKRSIRAELSRGIANGSSWNEMASRIAKGMNSPYNKAYNNAIRIARTEGHRIQQRSALDSQYAAKEKGADILKQWDSTLDNKTRPHHRRLDGQIRELDEPFEVDGLKADAPGHFGKASEDCNCRCCLLQRARWALDQDELDELKERAKFFGLDKAKDFEEFQDKYLKVTNIIEKIEKSNTMESVRAPSITNSKIQKSKEKFRDKLVGSSGSERHVSNMMLYDEVTEYVLDETASSPFQYLVNKDVISYNPNALHYDDYDMNYVQAHELSHRMDMIEYESFNNPEFINAIKTCRDKITDNQREVETWFENGGKYENNFAMSDIISALSDNEISVPIGHDSQYWKDEKNVALEIFANISSIDVLDDVAKEEFDDMLKELYLAYKEIVK